MKFRGIFATLKRRITVKSPNTSIEDIELEALYKNYKAREKTLEWRNHVLSKRSNQLKTVEDNTIVISPPVVQRSPSAEFTLDKNRYIEEGEKNPSGKANVVNYNGAVINYVSTHFENIPFVNMWKILTSTRPDIIVAQLRPDQILNNFKLNMYDSEEKFKEEEYFDQLVRKGSPN